MEKIYDKMWIYFLSLTEVFIMLFNDIFKTIVNSHKKYHWLMGTFLYMLLNSMVPLYYLFTNDITKIYTSGNFNSESGDYITYIELFKSSVLIFLLTLCIFAVKQFILLKKDVRESYTKKKRAEQLDYLLENYTIDPEEKKES